MQASTDEQSSAAVGGSRAEAELTSRVRRRFWLVFVITRPASPNDDCDDNDDN